MRRQRVKTLLNVVWSILDAAFETAEAETMSLTDTAKEMRLRNCIVETLDNPTIKGKTLVREVERLVQELIQLKRQHAQSVAKSATRLVEGVSNEAH
jgi:hypothetical protein